MRLNSLEVQPSRQKARKRLGRGQGSGKGKTAGRGNKGYHSRSGSKRRAWYEGGQMPLQRRVPKRGFTNSPFKKTYQIVTLSSIERLQLPKVDIARMWESGIIKSAMKLVKVLANGEIKSAVEITADAFSKTAVQKIENAGGKAIIR